MKMRLLGLLLGVMLVFGCVGCGTESKTTAPTATVTETTTEESTPEQTEEATATPEETTAPTPEATEEPSEETTVETEPETTEPEETVASAPTEEPTSEPQATYTYTDMSATMYAQQTVNVRDLPDTSGNKLGSLSTNDEIQISGQCNETGWYRFEYNGSAAFVSNKYVGENKVEVQTASSSGTGSTASHWYDNYPKQQWIDMGEYFFYICESNAEMWEVYGSCLNGRTEENYLWKPELLSRYPDRKVIYGGVGDPTLDMVVVSATIGLPTDPGFSWPTYLWN